MTEPRIVVWFSCGAASAVAAKMAVTEFGSRCTIAYCATGGEHPGNEDFLKRVQDWLGQPIEILKNKEGYTNHFDVFRKTKYLNGIRGARCTIELKKRPRFDFQRADDIHIFGYTVEEKHRADRFESQNPELYTDWILIRNNVCKEDCLGVLWKSGIEIPPMYLDPLKFNHNNCIMCPKGGKGYANKVRIHFPEAFAEMASIEREINHSIFRNDDGTRLYLDELDPKAGYFPDEPPISCGLGCNIIAGGLTDAD